VLSTSNGDIVQHAPVIFQGTDGSRTRVSGGYALSDGPLVGFGVGPYDESLPLTIDPLLAFSTYLGGSGADIAQGVAVDPAGNIYVVGQTYSADFPTEKSVTPDYQGDRDGFIAKLTPAGDAVLFATYLGGSGPDSLEDVAVDDAGNVYVTGFTSSPDFPTASPLYANMSTGPDVLMAKLSASGSTLLFSTFLGGSGYDYGYSIELGPAGAIFLSGSTQSSDFPTANAYDGIINNVSSNSAADIYITKLPATVDSLQWSTFLGGSLAESGNGLAVDHHGNVYVAGDSQSYDYPTVNAVKGENSGGGGDVVVTRVISGGGALIYSTYLGGTGEDRGYDIAVDRNRVAYVAARTQSTDYATVDPFQPELAGGWDAAVTAIWQTGTLVYSTYLGGTGTDRGRGVAVDEFGGLYVAGETSSADFPTLRALQETLGGSYDAFLVSLAPGTRALAYSTYLGGIGSDYPWGLASGAQGAVYLAGQTGSFNFPTVAPIQPESSGSNEAFVAKVTAPLDFFIAAIH
jgi:hypothetical protein